jgi:hypothetical protein
MIHQAQLRSDTRCRPAFHPSNPDIIHASSGGRLRTSRDGGKTWIWWDKESWAPWRNTCYEIAFDPDSPGKLWGAFSDVHDIPNDNIISERHGHHRPGGMCVAWTARAACQRRLTPGPIRQSHKRDLTANGPVCVHRAGRRQLTLMC